MVSDSSWCVSCHYIQRRPLSAAPNDGHEMQREQAGVGAGSAIPGPRMAALTQTQPVGPAGWTRLRACDSGSK